MPREELKSPQRRTLTKRLIREAMLELLKTKSIQKISVRELCDAAGVNRTTFYNHYDGTYEVLTEIEDHFLSQLSTADTISNCEDGLERHIEALCLKLKQNADTALLLLTNNADPAFSSKLLKTQGCNEIWQKAGSAYSSDETELLTEFVSGGAYSMVCRWLECGCRQSPKQVASLLTAVIQDGIKLKM